MLSHYLSVEIVTTRFSCRTRPDELAINASNQPIRTILTVIAPSPAGQRWSPPNARHLTMPTLSCLDHTTDKKTDPDAHPCLRSFVSVSSPHRVACHRLTGAPAHRRTVSPFTRSRAPASAPRRNGQATTDNPSAPSQASQTRFPDSRTHTPNWSRAHLSGRTHAF